MTISPSQCLDVFTNLSVDFLIWCVWTGELVRLICLCNWSLWSVLVPCHPGGLAIGFFVFLRRCCRIPCTSYVALKYDIWELANWLVCFFVHVNYGQCESMLRPRGLCDIRVELAAVRVNLWKPSLWIQIWYLRTGDLVCVVFMYVNDGPWYYGREASCDVLCGVGCCTYRLVKTVRMHFKYGT